MDFRFEDTFILPMVLKKLQPIATSLDNDGLVPRVNENSKRQPHYSLTYDKNGLKHLFVNIQETMPHRSQAAFQYTIHI